MEQIPFTHSSLTLPLCGIVSPEYREITCYRYSGHIGAHHGVHPRGDYHTWGLGVFNVVSVVDHRADTYVMLDDGHFGCCYVEDRGGAIYGHVDWRFKLWGLHVGPTLDVWLCNVRLDYEDDGPGSVAHWDTMAWADDHTLVEDDAMLDGYNDSLAPEIKEMLQER